MFPCLLAVLCFVSASNCNVNFKDSIIVDGVEVRVTQCFERVPEICGNTLPGEEVLEK